MAALPFSVSAVPLLFAVISKPEKQALHQLLQVMDKDIKWEKAHHTSLWSQLFYQSPDRVQSNNK